MEEAKSYTCKNCGGTSHSINEIKNHVKEGHGMDISDDEAKMMEDHEYEKKHNHAQ